ncbi:F510_1955 family glycosylhydrolase [Virgibacillus sp. DJP39]|uniref:F510_1955 family glycosylhydrolase n=1 Tax=Virgibacillus sp. DJP39 TaxID=3409790 RepID=UPI003BB7DCE1
MKNALLSILTGVAMFLVPLNVFAHGTEEHTNENAVNYWNYGLMASLLILVILLTLLILTKTKTKQLDLKKKENREKQQTLQKRNKIFMWGSIVFLLLAISSLIAMNASGEDKVTFTHIHGLGYTSNGEKIYVPSHDGLRVYNNGSWAVQTVGEKHDYMGFSMFENGFYSSGHPIKSSDLANPLGIVKSTDYGKTLELLDLYKEIDFHGMTVGYETEEIYVFNPKQNSSMDQPGFYYSTDETKTWKQGKLEGLEGQASSLAAHPTKEGVVAIGTDRGVFLSQNHGDNFEKLAVSGPVTAVSFGHQNNLLVATITDEVNLSEIDLTSKKVEELAIPKLGEDVIRYVKQNPATKDEFVFATDKKDIYISNDGGNNWTQSVDEGVAVSHQ